MLSRYRPNSRSEPITRVAKRLLLLVGLLSAVGECSSKSPMFAEDLYTYEFCKDCRTPRRYENPTKCKQKIKKCECGGTEWVEDLEDPEQVTSQELKKMLELRDHLRTMHCTKCAKIVTPGQSDADQCSDPKCGNKAKAGRYPWKMRYENVPAVELLQYVICQPGGNRVEDWVRAYDKIEKFKSEEGVNDKKVQQELAQHFKDYVISGKRLYLNFGETQDNQAFGVNDESKLKPKDYKRKGNDGDIFPVFFAAQFAILDAMHARIINMRRGSVFIANACGSDRSNLNLDMVKKRAIVYQEAYPLRFVAMSLVVGWFVKRVILPLALKFVNIPPHMEGRFKYKFSVGKSNSKNGPKADKYLGDKYGPGILPGRCKSNCSNPVPSDDYTTCDGCNGKWDTKFGGKAECEVGEWIEERREIRNKLNNDLEQMLARHSNSAKTQPGQEPQSSNGTRQEDEKSDVPVSPAAAASAEAHKQFHAPDDELSLSLCPKTVSPTVSQPASPLPRSTLRLARAASVPSSLQFAERTSRLGEPVYVQPFGTMYDKPGKEPWQKATIIGCGLPETRTVTTYGPTITYGPDNFLVEFEDNFKFEQLWVSEKRIRSRQLRLPPIKT